MVKDFMGFLKQYGVIGLAIAVVIGGKVNALVTAVVDGLIMPLVGLISPGADWRAMSIKLTSDVSETAPAIKIGLILGSLLDFIIVAFIVFWFAKKVLKEDSVTKK
jgi:large conductance mechanosensitive channel